MPFYDKVKDRVRKNENDEDGTDEEGDAVAFDQLIEDAKKNEEEDDEREPDDTEIEDLSGKSSKEYGDPSSIELDDDSSPQAGKPAENQSEGEKPERARRREAARQETRGEGAKERQPRSSSTSSSTTEEGERRPAGADPSASPRQRATVGDVREEDRQTEPGAAEGGDDVQEQETRKDILEDIRRQNRRMIDLLRGIKRSLDQGG